MIEEDIPANEQYDEQYKVDEEARTCELAQAEKDGLEVVRTNGRQLLLDIDVPILREDLPLAVNWQILTLPRTDCGKEARVFPTGGLAWRSKSGNWHVVINMRGGMEHHECIVLEMLLGSDLRRGAERAAEHRKRRGDK